MHGRGAFNLCYLTIKFNSMLPSCLALASACMKQGVQLGICPLQAYALHSQDAFTNERRINDEVANSKLLVVDNLITQTASLRIKKIDEIRDLSDRFVDELNRMREEDKVREMVYADLFFQTKTALQRSIQEEEDQRKLLEEGLQLQITDMMDAIKVEIDRDNRERERSEEARREKFQRDALKIRETLDDDRAKRIEAAATLSKAMDDQFADLQYNVDNERCSPCQLEFSIASVSCRPTCYAPVLLLHPEQAHDPSPVVQARPQGSRHKDDHRDPV